MLDKNNEKFILESITIIPLAIILMSSSISGKELTYSSAICLLLVSIFREVVVHYYKMILDIEDVESFAYNYFNSEAKVSKLVDISFNEIQSKAISRKVYNTNGLVNKLSTERGNLDWKIIDKNIISKNVNIELNGVFVINEKGETLYIRRDLL